MSILARGTETTVGSVSSNFDGRNRNTPESAREANRTQVRSFADALRISLTSRAARCIDSLEGERLSARVREAIWVSLIFHLFVFWWIFYGPKLKMFRPATVVNTMPEVPEKAPENVYLDMPPDLVKKPPKPTNIISDQNHTAQTKNPTPDQKTIEQLQAMRRAGRPSPPPQPQQKAQQPEQPAARPQQPSPQESKPALCRHPTRLRLRYRPRQMRIPRSKHRGNPRSVSRKRNRTRPPVSRICQWVT